MSSALWRHGALGFEVFLPNLPLILCPHRISTSDIYVETLAKFTGFVHIKLELLS